MSKTNNKETVNDQPTSPPASISDVVDTIYSKDFGTYDQIMEEMDDKHLEQSDMYSTKKLNELIEVRKKKEKELIEGMKEEFEEGQYEGNAKEYMLFMFSDQLSTIYISRRVLECVKEYRKENDYDEDYGKDFEDGVNLDVLSEEDRKMYLHFKGMNQEEEE